MYTSTQNYQTSDITHHTYNIRTYIFTRQHHHMYVPIETPSSNVIHHTLLTKQHSLNSMHIPRSPHITNQAHTFNTYIITCGSAHTFNTPYKLPYALKFSQDETFTVFADWKPCVNILSLRKFRLSSCAMIKMAVKRTGVAEKHCSAFALFSKNFHLQTNEVWSVKGLKGDSQK